MRSPWFFPYLFIKHYKNRLIYKIFIFYKYSKKSLFHNIKLTQRSSHVFFFFFFCCVVFLWGLNVSRRGVERHIYFRGAKGDFPFSHCCRCGSRDPQSWWYHRYRFAGKFVSLSFFSVLCLSSR